MPIYEPGGRARDDSENAFNIYTACSHRCKYCYAPAIFMKKREDWFTDNATPRKDFLKELLTDIPKHAGQKAQVLFCFTNDPYGGCDPKFRATRKALEQFLKYEIPVAILSKGGYRVCEDIDVFKKFGEHIKIGQTLTFDNTSDSLEWESGAAIPEERIDTARKIHEAGIKTFASIEPVVFPVQSMKMIELSIPYIAEYRVGKLNRYKGMDKSVDWKKFLHEAVDYLRENKKQIFIKKDLADFDSDYLTEDEKNPDKWQAIPW
jgi:DNA repair photolyase